MLGSPGPFLVFYPSNHAVKFRELGIPNGKPHRHPKMAVELENLRIADELR